MKSKQNLLSQLKSLPHFTKQGVFQLGQSLGLTQATIDTYISRFIGHHDIIRLKNGLYVTTDFYNKNKGDISYTFYLANVIRQPSYVSSWAALQYYGLTTEAIHSITSVTRKVTRNYQTKVGDFAYQSINSELFGDFSLVKGQFDFFIASPAKALFDLIYFRTNQFSGTSVVNIKSVIEQLRIDWDDLDTVEQTRFNAMIKKYE